MKLAPKLDEDEESTTTLPLGMFKSPSVESFKFGTKLNFLTSENG